MISPTPWYSVPNGRYRSNVSTLYDVFCELGAPKPGEKLAPLRQQYPGDFDPSIVQSVQQFAFPCQLREVELDAVQLFSFVLTDSNSKFSFGFCRYTPITDTCICILSGFFWPNIFFKVLNEMALVIGSAQKEDVDSVLAKLYHTDIPNIGEYLQFADSNQEEGHNHRIEIDEQIPDQTLLPNLATDQYYLEFYNAIDPAHMIAIFASLLRERRILITGQKVSTLSSCLHAVSSLLNPLSWQSVFIPVLPDSLVDMIMAPEPYLIGVPKAVLDNARLNLRDIEDVVILDIDDKTLTRPFDDVASMPSELCNFLKMKLSSQPVMGDEVAKAFLRALVLLFGDYSNGFVSDSTDFTWSKETFIEQKQLSYKPFMHSLLAGAGIRYLEQFVADRKALHQLGAIPEDMFEISVECFLMKRPNNPMDKFLVTEGTNTSSTKTLVTPSARLSPSYVLESATDQANAKIDTQAPSGNKTREGKREITEKDSDQPASKIAKNPVQYCLLGFYVNNKKPVPHKKLVENLIRRGLRIPDTDLLAALPPHSSGVAMFSCENNHAINLIDEWIVSSASPTNQKEKVKMVSARFVNERQFATVKLVQMFMKTTGTLSPHPFVESVLMGDTAHMKSWLLSLDTAHLQASLKNLSTKEQHSVQVAGRKESIDYSFWTNLRTPLPTANQ